MDTKVHKIIYFVRHGQTVDNALPVFQSENSPLSKKGKTQSQSIAERLSEIQFETLISSPLARAKETARYISQATGKSIEYSDLFTERVKPTELDGKSWTDVQAYKVWREWEKSLYGIGKRVSDSENYKDILARADKALLFLSNRPEQSLTVVTHRYFLKAIIARVLVGPNLTGRIMRQFQARTAMDNTGITALVYSNTFEEDAAWRLLTYNDHSHFVE